MNANRAIDLAVENVLKEGLTDVFPRPFEVALLERSTFRNEIRATLAKRLGSNSLDGLHVRPIQHVLSPKRQAFDFRRVALMDPLDTIAYLALAIMLAPTIETAQPQKRRRIVFSYRYKPSAGYLFDPKYTFTAFKNRVREKCRQSRVKVLVKCDIASFYDRLNLHRLESSLLALGCDKGVVGLVNQLLLFWANRDSYGLPTGSNGSRILAEAALIPVDRFLLEHGVPFARFVDDYRLFAPDQRRAHLWLTQLIERLQLEGLQINPAKTQLNDVSQLPPEASPTRHTEAQAGQASEEDTRASLRPEAERSRNAATTRPRIIAGYGGPIPTLFREASPDEQVRLAQRDPQALLDTLSSSSIVKPDDLREAIKVTVYREEFERLSQLPVLLDRFPQFYAYVVDVLKKRVDEIPSAVRHALRDAFGQRLLVGNFPEYVSIAVVELLGTDGYADRSVLMQYFRSLSRHAGAYIGRALLDALASLVDRNDVIEIRSYFDRADGWEQRAIARIVDSNLEEDEKRPWLKNVKVHAQGDPLLRELVAPTSEKGTKSKRKKK